MNFELTVFIHLHNIYIEKTNNFINYKSVIYSYVAAHILSYWKCNIKVLVLSGFCLNIIFA